MTRSVAADRNNKIWACTDNGLVKIYEDSIQVYNCNNSPIIKSKIGRTMVKNLAIDTNNNKWFSDWSNIYKYDDKSIYIFALGGHYDS